MDKRLLGPRARRPTGSPLLVDGIPSAPAGRGRRRVDGAARWRRRSTARAAARPRGVRRSLVGAITGLVDGYRIFAPDLPGLGRSELRGGPFGPTATTEWLDGLIAATFTARPIVVGFSAGAGIAVRYVLWGADGPAGWSWSAPLARSARLTLSLRAALIRFARNPSRRPADRVARHLLFDAELAMVGAEAATRPLEDYYRTFMSPGLHGGQPRLAG